MSEVQNIEERPALVTPPRGPERTAARPAAALWLALAALAGVLLLAWLAWLGYGRLDTAAQRLAAGEIAQREAQVAVKQDRAALDALQAKVGGLEAQLAEARSQQLALEAMYQELSRTRDDRLLAEVEQDVALAAQQLQLAGNVGAALIALQSAEARLARSAQPRFLSLRKLIARDSARLKAMPGADLPGIALKLEMIVEAVPNLPLAFERRPVPAVGEPPAPVSAPAWQAVLRDWLAELWREARQLVRVERIDRPDPGLLAPREVFFLRENLRLRLLSARLALLARDGRSFRADVRQAARWLEQYFNVQVPAVKEALAALQGLDRLEMMREPVALDETLAALRNLRLRSERGDRAERGAAR